MDKAFFEENRKRIAKTLEKDSLLILFAGRPLHCSQDEYYPFVPNKNFYYLTGIEENKIVLFIEKRGASVRETLFIQKPDPIMEKWIGKSMTEEEAKKCSGIVKVMFLDQLDSHFAGLLNSYGFKNLYLDLFKNNADDGDAPAHIFASMAQGKYPQIRVKNIYHQIRHLRMIKQPDEIKEIRKALAITKAGIERIISQARPGMMEYEAEANFDFILKSKGKFKNAFSSIVASGKNAATLHYCANNNQIKSGSLVLLDLGAACNYYCSDISRTFPIDGKFTERQRIIYSIVLKAQQAVMDAIRPGVSFKELNDIAKRTLADECKKIGLIKEDKELSKYYFHGVSHSLGLDTHDVADPGRKLEKGMVITVEPGLYIEEEEIGVRLEDDVLVTKDGYENLSSDIIKQPEEIETFMQSRKII